MFVVSEHLELSEGVVQKFADEEKKTEAASADKISGSVPESAEKPKKKKKVVRRVVKKHVASSPEEKTTSKTDVGSRLNEADITALRAVLYYLSDTYPDKAVTMQADISKSLETRCVESPNVSTIVDTASMDLRNTGSSASMSLGIEDGGVSDTCMLPKLLARLSELEMQ
ncbi:hypothetical protein MAJ_10428, partial [Metarhizium majus ARSEF 297]